LERRYSLHVSLRSKAAMQNARHTSSRPSAGSGQALPGQGGYNQGAWFIS